MLNAFCVVRLSIFAQLLQIAFAAGLSGDVQGIFAKGLTQLAAIQLRLLRESRLGVMEIVWELTFGRLGNGKYTRR
jgi:hypothetical protein